MAGTGIGWGFGRSVVVAGFAAGVALGTSEGRAEPPQPASAQPSLPQPIAGGVPLASPIIGGGQGKLDQAKPDQAKLDRAKPDRVRIGRAKARHFARYHGRIASHRRFGGEPLERPALAGVELVTPIPHPIQPPHFTVPVPAYPFENFVTYYTTPPPPVFCHRAPRDPDAPDPHLIGERPVLCEADNP